MNGLVESNRGFGIVIVIVIIGVVSDVFCAFALERIKDRMASFFLFFFRRLLIYLLFFLRKCNFYLIFF